MPLTDITDILLVPLTHNLEGQVYAYNNILTNALTEVLTDLCARKSMVALFVAIVITKLFSTYGDSSDTI